MGWALAGRQRCVEGAGARAQGARARTGRAGGSRGRGRAGIQCTWCRQVGSAAHLQVSQVHERAPRGHHHLTPTVLCAKGVGGGAGYGEQGASGLCRLGQHIFTSMPFRSAQAPSPLPCGHPLPAAFAPRHSNRQRLHGIDRQPVKAGACSTAAAACWGACAGQKPPPHLAAPARVAAPASAAARAGGTPPAAPWALAPSRLSRGWAARQLRPLLRPPPPGAPPASA